MKKEEIIQLALNENFESAVIVKTTDMVFDPSFRPFCEQNLCGQYGANYSCPPDCGSPEAMKEAVLKYQHALVLQSIWDVTDYRDMEMVSQARNGHNSAQLRLMDALSEAGYKGLMIGAGNCTLCDSCVILSGEPCRYPEKKYSCLSAYCINVKELTDCCSMSYSYGEGKLALFGVCAFG